MADEPNKTAEGTEAPAETSSADTESKTEGAVTEKRFSQAEVDLMVTKAKEKAARATERKVRQELEAKKDPSPVEAKPQPQQAVATDRSDSSGVSREEFAALQAQIAEERRGRLFAESIAGRNIAKETAETLRKHFNPDDMDSFEELLDLAAAASAVKTDPAPASNGTNGQAAQTQVPSVAQPPQYRSPGSPAGQPDGEFEWDLRKAGKDQISRWQADGSYPDRVKRFRANLPGGGGGYFMPKGGTRKA